MNELLLPPAQTGERQCYDGNRVVDTPPSNNRQQACLCRRCQRQPQHNSRSRRKVHCMRDRSKCTNTSLIVGIAVLKLAAGVWAVFWSRTLRLMQGYEYFVTQLLFPISICALTWPVVWLVLGAGKRCRIMAITPQQRATPKWKFAAIAVMAGVSNYAGAWPSAALPGALQTVINQLGTPALMIMSFLILGTRYRPRHIVAALLIVGASAVVVAPSLVHESVSLFPGGLWLAMLIALCFDPESIFAEKWMKAVNMNVWYWRANFGAFEVLLGLLLLPTVFLPIPGRSHVTPSQLLPHLAQGWRCFAYGIVPPGTPPGTVMCADSLPAWATYTLQMFAVLVDVLCGLALTKYSSAVVNALVSAIGVPVGILMFQSEALAGVKVQHGVTTFTFIGGLAATAGVLLYTSAPERSQQRQLSIARALSIGGNKDTPPSPKSLLPAVR